MTAPTTNAATTIGDVYDFIHEQADADDLEQIFAAYKARRKILQEKRSLGVKTGVFISLTDLSPKYLNGLRGTVEAVRNTRVDVRLDSESTQLLRVSGKRFYVPHDVETYLLSGVPKTCCLTQD